MTNDYADLLVLTADAHMEAAVDAILSRPNSLCIRKIRFKVRRHPEHDSGCRTKAVSYLRNYLDSYRYALVMFDRDGCGSNDCRLSLQDSLENELHGNGWSDRSKVIVIEPELESWIFTPSLVSARAFGCNTSSELESLLQANDLLPPGASKPPDPKYALKKILESNGIPFSAAIFRKVARNASLRRCSDPAFLEFIDTLRVWFPT